MQAEFSDQVKDILQTSGKLAIRFNYDYIDSEHLLLAIIDESLKNRNVILDILKHFNIDILNLIETIEASFDKSKTSITKVPMPITKSSEMILKLSYLEAKIFTSDTIEAEHLFLSYLRCKPGFCERILNVKYQLTYDEVKNYMKSGG